MYPYAVVKAAGASRDTKRSKSKTCEGLRILLVDGGRPGSDSSHQYLADSGPKPYVRLRVPGFPRLRIWCGAIFWECGLNKSSSQHGNFHHLASDASIYPV